MVAYGPMRERAVVTGVGCISSFGIGSSPFAEALADGSSGIRPVTAFSTTGCRSHRAAMITGFDPEAFIPPLKLRRIDNAGRLAIVCARLACEDAGRTLPWEERS